MNINIYIYPKSKPNFCPTPAESHPTPAESGATPAESSATPAESGPLLRSLVPLRRSPVTPSGISGALKSTGLVAGRYISNTDHGPSIFVLRQMLAFYHAALVLGEVER